MPLTPVQARPNDRNDYAAAEIRAEMARQGLNFQGLADLLGWSIKQVLGRIGPKRPTTAVLTLAEVDEFARVLRVPFEQFAIREPAARSRRAG